MTIITQESIDYLKDRRDKAKKSGSYEAGYATLMEGISSAIAQLEQLKVLTNDFQISLSVKDEK